MDESKQAAPEDEIPDPDYKVILLGDSAVGKSKLVERFLMDDYNPRQVRNMSIPAGCASLTVFAPQLSTYALTLFRKAMQLEGDSKMSTIGEEGHIVGLPVHRLIS